MWTSTPTDVAAERAVQALTSYAAGGRLGGAMAALEGLSPAAWDTALAIVDENRLLGRVGQALVERGLDRQLPADVACRLRRASAEKSARNTERMRRYAAIAGELARRGIEPVVLKSAALVTLLHPTQASHEMSDVDVYVRPDELAEVEAVLAAHGLVAVERLPHASDYRDAEDLLRVDLHHRFEMFGERDLVGLTTVLPTAAPGFERVRVLAPDAMLSHLAVHLNEHRDRLGYRLRWMCDLALALALWRSEFRWQRVAELLPERRHRVWALRTVGFCARHLGVAAPPDLSRWIDALEPFGFDEVLRSQRVKPWRLTTARSWARLAATAMGLREAGGWPLPRTDDAVGTALDERRERRALARLAELEQAERPEPTPRPAAPAAPAGLPLASPVGVAHRD